MRRDRYWGERKGGNLTEVKCQVQDGWKEELEGRGEGGDVLGSEKWVAVGGGRGKHEEGRNEGGSESRG